MYLKMKKTLLYFWNILWDIHMIVYEWWLLATNRQPQVMGIEETLHYIIKEKCSVARYGDGEMKFISGEKTSFQQFDISLQLRLSEILKGGNQKLLICIPGVFGALDIYADEYKAYWKQYLLRNRSDWYNHIDENYIYGEAFISRCYLTYKDRTKVLKYFNLWKQIWSNKDILIVEGAKTRLGVGNDLFNNVRSIKRILAPNTEVFACYEELIAEVRQYETNYLILLALGPTATILAADLSKEGYQAIDIGHIDIEYEWMRMGVDSRVAVHGKFVNEAANGRVVSDCDDQDYLNQIIRIIN